MLFLPSPVASGKCASRESCKVRNMYLHAACAHQVNSTLAGHFCPPVRAKRGLGWYPRQCYLVPRRLRREEVLSNAAKTRQRNVLSRLQ